MPLPLQVQKLVRQKQLEIQDFSVYWDTECEMLGNLPANQIQVRVHSKQTHTHAHTHTHSIHRVNKSLWSWPWFSLRYCYSVSATDSPPKIGQKNVSTEEHRLKPFQTWTLEQHTHADPLVRAGRHDGVHAEPETPVHLRAGVRVGPAAEERRQGAPALAPLGPHWGPGAAGAHGPAAVPGLPTTPLFLLFFLWVFDSHWWTSLWWFATGGQRVCQPRFTKKAWSFTVDGPLYDRIHTRVTVCFV